MEKQLYPYIVKRKSTRRYAGTPLERETLNKVEAFIQTLTPLLADCAVTFKIVSGAAVKGAIGIKAPHYILVGAEEVSGHLMNVGFLLQQLDLFFAAEGIGGCWVGMAKPMKEVKQMLDLPFVIAYAFGEPTGALYQTAEGRSRKAYEAIQDGNLYKPLIEAARLAPSATNAQPWYFVTKPDGIDVYRIKNNPIKGFFLDRMNQIDIGIALCHIWVAAQFEGRSCRFFLRHVKEVEAIQGHYYMMSAEIG